LKGRKARKISIMGTAAETERSDWSTKGKVYDVTLDCYRLKSRRCL